MKKTRILIVDDHQIIIDGIKVLLEDIPNFEVSLSSNSGAEALETLKTSIVDIVLLDINLPDLDGFQICKKIKSNHPHCKIIALTMFGEPAYIMKMIKAGVDGYLLKNTGKRELLVAIESVMKGNKYFSAEVQANLFMEKAASSPNLIQKISRREKEILQLIVEEHTTDQIAAKLFISSTTVISHRKSLLRKLQAKNTAGLVKAAYEYRLLD